MAEDDENQVYHQKETKIIYHIDEETTPYLVKIPLPPSQVKLRDFKIILSKQQTCNYKFFFKSMDADFGYVPLFTLIYSLYFALQLFLPFRLNYLNNL